MHMRNREEKRHWIHSIFQNVRFYVLFQKAINFIYSGLDKNIKNLLYPYLNGKRWVLDLGCGTGEYSLSPSGMCVGIDLNHEHLRYAVEHQRDGETFFAGMLSSELGFRDKSLDCAVAVRLFYHLSDEVIAGTIKELKRVIKRVIKRGYSIIKFDIIDPGPGRYIIHKLIHTDRGKYMRTLAESRNLLAGSLGLPAEEKSVRFKGNPFPYRLWVFKVS